MEHKILYSDTGYSSGKTFLELCELVESFDMDSPARWGYTENEVRWLTAPESADERQDWPDGCPYWYART